MSYGSDPLDVGQRLPPSTLRANHRRLLRTYSEHPLLLLPSGLSPVAASKTRSSSRVANPLSGGWYMHIKTSPTTGAQTTAILLQSAVAVVRLPTTLDELFFIRQPLVFFDWKTSVVDDTLSILQLQAKG